MQIEKHPKFGWLQLFAGKAGPGPDDLDDDLDEDEDLDTDADEDADDDDETEGEEPEDEESEGGDDEGEEGSPSKQKGKKPEGSEEKLIPQSRVKSIIQDRIARVEKKYQREIETLKSETSKIKDQVINEIKSYAGVDFDEATAKEALRFYAYLQANPTHAQAWNEYLVRNPWKNHPQFQDKSSRVKPEEIEAKLEAKLELQETLRDLRQDPLFKKYEQRVRDYAEDEGIDITTAKGLKMAWKAWRGENTRLIAANARTEGERAAKKAKDKKQSAKLQSSSGPKASAKKDPTKLSDKDFLAAKGLSLYTND